MKATSMTLTRKRQTVLPLDWCRQQGLENGGQVNVFDLGDAGLLVRPLRPPSAKEIRELLGQTPAGRHSRNEAAKIVRKAMKKARAG